MKPEQWQVIEKLYHSASALPVEEWREFLEEACSQDHGLFEELESLLSYGPRPRTVLDTAAIALLAKAMAADQRDLPAPLLEGQSISHYRIVEPIGRGGMGAVYKAEDLRLRRYVALKLLPGYLAADQETLKRFEREAQAASTRTWLANSVATSTPIPPTLAPSSGNIPTPAAACALTNSLRQATSQRIPLYNK
jgi:hypothetical protein